MSVDPTRPLCATTLPLRLSRQDFRQDLGKVDNGCEAVMSSADKNDSLAEFARFDPFWYCDDGFMNTKFTDSDLSGTQGSALQPQATSR